MVESGLRRSCAMWRKVMRSCSAAALMSCTSTRQIMLPMSLASAASPILPPSPNGVTIIICARPPRFSSSVRISPAAFARRICSRASIMIAGSRAAASRSTSSRPRSLLSTSFAPRSTNTG
ncbi:hypothetical protein [Burkholderia gladioli]|uniref:hypothetical protein n=1 Tax=Burkholderia gladioli TaxID=28095 RepID=UPI003A4D686C